MTINIFEKASRQKLRFASSKGELNTEQLWDLSLTDLDTLARATHKELSEAQTGSFISAAIPVATTRIELRLDILKRVIEVKLDSQDAAKNRLARDAQKEKIMEALASKEDDALNKKSKAQLLKELEELAA